jgi:hypothetical protein
MLGWQFDCHPNISECVIAAGGQKGLVDGGLRGLYSGCGFPNTTTSAGLSRRRQAIDGCLSIVLNLRSALCQEFPHYSSL